ncbi:thioredoxin-dependent thiol peroxidase [Helicobacter cetorum]|uniref:thioredoxin-dependent thiol peroxidase n=1 Tax=Helicobacter cetorum TaxID=138563 RepID=UPI000CF16297|nr:thioredoxin-dependent thiol peroxidase [Helicobacter cetorum]
MQKLEVGQVAPNFRLKNSDGVEISLKDLLHKKVVLYFYPKDNTPGCTLEAQDFSALFSEFEKKNAIVVGVSPDSAKSHQSFIEKCSLNVILLCDENKEVANLYKAYGKKMMCGKEYMGIIRSTFIINQEGVLEKCFYNVKAKNHAQKVLESL